jgi:hypothetical protein
MSNAKKVLSILLAVVMVACLSVNAFAAVSYETDTTMTQTWTLSEATEVGTNEYQVNVSLTTNYPTGSIQFVVENTDNTNAVLTGATLGAAYPADYEGEISFSNSTGKVMIIVGSGEDTLPGVAIDGVVATLTYTYSGTGSATLTIADAPKTEAAPDGTLIAARLSNGNAITGTEIVGQTATVSGTATIGAASLPADLELTAAGNTAGVKIDTHKTFGGAYAGVVYGFTRLATNTFKSKTYLTNNLQATNNGSLLIKTSDNKTAASGNYGTGATIEVLNSDGTSTGKIYVVVIFGDVDQNGLINTTDASVVKGWASKPATAPAANTYLRLAANCYKATAAAVMHNIQTNDATAIKGFNSNNSLKFDPVQLAASHSALNSFYQ